MLKNTNTSFWRRFAVLIAVLSVTFGGGVAFANHQFNDVPTSSIFHDEIDFMVQRSITLGCGGANYCPSNDVTREQMAAFLERTARALSPTVLSAQSTSLTKGDPECVIGPYTPDFEQVATFNGGLYAQGPGPVDSRVQYSANGGPWIDVSGAWYIRQTADASPAYGSTPVVGYQQLDPGTEYKFSIDAANLGSGTGDSGCELTAIIQHQMPEAAPGPAPFTGPDTQVFAD